MEWGRPLYFYAVVCSSFFFFFFSSPNLSRRRLDVCHTSHFHTWCGLSVNLECMSETSCTRLAENTGRKNDAKNRHLGTIAQLCRAISSQLRHISTIGKNLLSSNTSSTCPHNMVNFGPLAAEIDPVVWGTPCKFQRVSRLGSVTARHLHRVSEKLDPLLFHRIFASTATNCMKISRST